MGFERTISEGERQQTYALDRAATGTGWLSISWTNKRLDNIRMHGTTVKNIGRYCNGL
jgi:hypothetical protein